MDNYGYSKNIVQSSMTSCQAMFPRVSFSVSESEVEVYSVGGDNEQSILQQFLFSASRCRVYEHVGALLVHVYQSLYTKIPFRNFLFIDSHVEFYHSIGHVDPAYANLCLIGFHIISVLYTLFQFASTPMALVLFWAAEKRYQNQLHTSRADITVSYILLIGAIALDVSSTISTFPSYYQVPSAWWNKKQWSEKLGQYSIISRYIGLPEVTHTPMINKDDGDGGEGSPSPINARSSSSTSY